jgi:hypothetical protein
MLEQLKNFTSQSASSKVSCHQKQLQWGIHSLIYRCQLRKRSHHSITTTSVAETVAATAESPNTGWASGRGVCCWKDTVMAGSQLEAAAHFKAPMPCQMPVLLLLLLLSSLLLLLLPLLPELLLAAASPICWCHPAAHASPQQPHACAEGRAPPKAPDHGAYSRDTVTMLLVGIKHSKAITTSSSSNSSRHQEGLREHPPLLMHLSWYNRHLHQQVTLPPVLHLCLLPVCFKQHSAS